MPGPAPRTAAQAGGHRGHHGHLGERPGALVSPRTGLRSQALSALLELRPQEKAGLSVSDDRAGRPPRRQGLSSTWLTALGPGQGAFTLETLAPGSLHYRGLMFSRIPIAVHGWRAGMENPGRSLDSGVRNETRRESLGSKTRGRRFSPWDHHQANRGMASGSLRLGKSVKQSTLTEVNSPPVLTGLPFLHRAWFQAQVALSPARAHARWGEEATGSAQQ